MVQSCGWSIEALCHKARRDHKMRSGFFATPASARPAEFVRVRDAALEEGLVRRARRAIARLGTERLGQSYFTTFWLARGESPGNPVEEAVLALFRVAAPGPRCAGAEWWIGRSYTNDVPVGFHFDQDVRAARGLRHPLLSTVFFFNHVRGGQLAVTDQRAGPGGEPRTEAARPARQAARDPGREFLGPAAGARALWRAARAYRALAPRLSRR